MPRASTRATPGRAAAKLGPGRVLDFQTAYLGGLTRAIGIGAGTGRGGRRPVLRAPGPPGPAPSRAPAAPAEPATFERLARTIAGAADSRDLALPRKPWLDQLPALFDLAGLPVAGEGLLPVGMLDEPEEQGQSPFVLDLDTIGNLVILGTGGAGKTARAPHDRGGRFGGGRDASGRRLRARLRRRRSEHARIAAHRG